MLKAKEKFIPTFIVSFILIVISVLFIHVNQSFAKSIDIPENIFEEPAFLEVNDKIILMDSQTQSDILDEIKAAEDEKAKEIKKAKAKAKKIKAERKAKQEAEKAKQNPGRYSGATLRNQGVINEGGWRYTWYSSRVLHHYRTSEWTADSEGIYRDSDGYVVVACTSRGFGATVPTPFGTGKVYDSGCAAGTIDIYVNF